MFSSTRRIIVFPLFIFYIKTLYGDGGTEQGKGHDKDLKVLNVSRRIMSGSEALDTLPFMVYLQAAPPAEGQVINPNWLCGGAIVADRYILTSAACIEDVQNFFVISGTHKWSKESNDCIKNGRKRAIWKCVTKDFYYDGHEFDNIRWMIDDIAVVQVESDFNFNKRIIGCDFVPKKISYNNLTRDHEKPGTLGTIAGWGSTERYGDVASGGGGNSPELLEAEVQVISKKRCKKGWPTRYHYIIDGSMICAHDGDGSGGGGGAGGGGGGAMSASCTDLISCKEIIHQSDVDDDDDDFRRSLNETNLLNSSLIHGASHINVDNGRRFYQDDVIKLGGFCENDHGGPLTVGHGNQATIVGVITACQTTNVTKKCFGPYLFTSVYKNRELINCAINKELGGLDGVDYTIAWKATQAQQWDGKYPCPSRGSKLSFIQIASAI